MALADPARSPVTPAHRLSRVNARPNRRHADPAPAAGLPPRAEPAPPERFRDHVYKWVTLLLARLALPVAIVFAPWQNARSLACEWALAVRFPSEDLNGLTDRTRHALLQARSEALWRHGELIGLTSGRRSVAAQQRLFDKAVEKHGSQEEALRWVLTPDRSAHVRGTALDIRPYGGARWLDRHGHRYGLHRTFDHEWWHFEYFDQPRV